jgi:hypothetical protein
LLLLSLLALLLTDRAAGGGHSRAPDVPQERETPRPATAAALWPRPLLFSLSPLSPRPPQPVRRRANEGSSTTELSIFESQDENLPAWCEEKGKRLRSLGRAGTRTTKKKASSAAAVVVVARVPEGTRKKDRGSLAGITREERGSGRRTDAYFTRCSKEVSSLRSTPIAIPLRGEELPNLRRSFRRRDEEAGPESLVLVHA